MDCALNRLDAPPAWKPLRIGTLVIDPPVLQAPMAGFTNFAFRHVVRGFGGAGLLATEMISARGFIYMDRRQEGYPDRLWGIETEPRPLAVQIWDNDPEVMAQVGARLAHELHVSLVDMNFGCPDDAISQRAKSGAYLLRDPDRIGRLVARVVEACRPVPATAKIRLGCTRDTINAVDVAQAVEQAGGFALTVHGRTAQEMYRGKANWDEIARIKPYLKRIPLIGNGDLRTPRAVVEALQRYPVDGVMIGRAALTKPWIFQQVEAALRGQPIPPDPSLEQQRQRLLEHYRLILDHFGARKGTVLMRRFAGCYSRGLPGARDFRNQIARALSPEEFVESVNRFFPVTGSEAPACDGRILDACPDFETL